MLLGSVGYMILGVAPVLFGALVDAGRLTDAALGQVATVETLALAAGAAVGPAFLRRGGLRGKLVAGCVALAVLDLVCARASGGAALGVLRGFCGALEGLLLAGALLVVMYSRQPERMSGYFMAITTAPQVAAVYLLSAFLIPAFGADAGFGLMAGLAIFSLLATLVISDHTVLAAESLAAPEGVWNSAAIIGCLAIFLQNAAIGAAWNYLEQIGHEATIPADSVGLAIAGLLVCQLVGATAVGWVGWRLNHTAVLAGGCVVLAGDCVALTLIHAPAGFVAACCVFGLLWLALIPFQVKLLVQIDPSRQLALLLSPISLIGLSVGPLAGSLLVRQADVSPSFFLACGVILLAGAMYGVAAWGGRAARAVG
jgi:MFS family permease